MMNDLICEKVYASFDDPFPLIQWIPPTSIHIPKENFVKILSNSDKPGPIEQIIINAGIVRQSIFRQNFSNDVL